MSVWMVERISDGALLTSHGRLIPKSQFRDAKIYREARFASTAITNISFEDYLEHTKRHDWRRQPEEIKQMYRARYRKVRYDLIRAE